MPCEFDPSGKNLLRKKVAWLLYKYPCSIPSPFATPEYPQIFLSLPYLPPFHKLLNSPTPELFNSSTPKLF